VRNQSSVENKGLTYLSHVLKLVGEHTMASFNALSASEEDSVALSMIKFLLCTNFPGSFVKRSAPHTHTHSLSFFFAPLSSSCSAVFGNRLIISFPPSGQERGNFRSHAHKRALFFTPLMKQ